jgi:hypothetical protein
VASNSMTPERWRQVTEVFHTALARHAAARAAYLDHACADDRALRDEVDAMLAAHQDTGGFGDRPVSGLIGDVRRLDPGAMLGPYRIDRLIGVGSMGEVYRARDTKLDRDVAVKILPEAFAAGPERIARFQREAKTLASLNHPNIAVIHGLEESGGVRALVMELVEGDDLSQRIARGAIPLEEALQIGPARPSPRPTQLERSEHPWQQPASRRPLGSRHPFREPSGRHSRFQSADGRRRRHDVRHLGPLERRRAIDRGLVKGGQS